MGSGQAGDDGSFVVVPRSPGPLVRLVPGEARDDLDDLIDELFPDSDEDAGWTDVALLVSGAALLVWGILGDGPGLATVAGAVAVGLGVILPLRSLWRRLSARRRRAQFARGVPLRVEDPQVIGLVTTYEQILAGAGADISAVAASHAVLLEVGTLLAGRSPASEPEQRYVAERLAALESLAAALSPAATAAAEEAPVIEPHVLVEARDELDRLAGTSSLDRLEQLTQSIRADDDRSG